RRSVAGRRPDVERFVRRPAGPGAEDLLRIAGRDRAHARARGGGAHGSRHRASHRARAAARRRRAGRPPARPRGGRLARTGGAAPGGADAAAARVLATAGASVPGPHLAELETHSVRAYEHFVRSYRASVRGDAAESRRELDLAIALDSGFVSALYARMAIAEA